MDVNKTTEQIIGAAIEVHRVLGPGLLESAYEECLCHELGLRGISFDRQKPLPIEYKGVKLECGHRLDLLVTNHRRGGNQGRLVHRAYSRSPIADLFADRRLESRLDHQLQCARFEGWHSPKSSVTYILLCVLCVSVVR